MKILRHPVTASAATVLMLALTSGNSWTLGDAPPVPPLLGRVTQPPREPHRGLRAQFDAADLVFEGIVRDVSHRMSDATDAAEVSLPMTYVTFDVIEVFWGIAQQRTARQFTLRMLGGPAPDGRRMFLSGQPEFAVGDREIVLFRRNHRGVASVLRGGERRFRIRGDDVFGEGCGELRLAPDGDLVSVRTHDDVASGRLENEVTATPTAASPRVTAASLRQLMRELARTPSPAKLMRTLPVLDVAIADPIRITRPTPEPMQSFESGTATMPAAEREERVSTRR
ncbi:MAG: hypothetical protein R3F56_21915 [Planctomycetota bacterium]